MPTGRAVTIAAVLASIALLPIIIILALGLYGSAVTGDFPLVDESGPKMRVEPESGPPGSELTIRGSRWDEGTLLRLEMVVQVARPQITFGGDIETVEQPLPGVYVGEVVISRAGTFTIETQLPTTVPLLPGTQIEFLGSAAYRGGEPAGEGRTTFLVEPAPGQLDVEVLADASGGPLPRTLVEVRGLQGQLVAAGHTGTDGMARFEGLASDVAYQVTARAAGYDTLRAPSVEAGVETPGEVTFVLPAAAPGSVFVGGVPRRGEAESPTLAVIDLPSLAPVRDAEIKAAGAAWALAADPGRGRLYVADELATEIRVFNVQTGRIAAAIPLAFSLRVEVRDEDDRPPASAVVHLLWSVRGSEVLVRARETDASGVAVFDDLIAGSSYVVSAMTASAESLGRTAEAAGPITVHQSPNPVTIEPHQTARATVTLDSDFAQMFYGGEPQLLAGNDRAPATSLVVADMAVDPVSGLLYVTGSDLDRGHLFVIDPDERRIVHDWRVRAGVGDVVPRGDGETVYIANRAFSTVALVDVATGEERQSVKVPSWPEAITADTAGNVFVASLRDGSVTRLDADTLEISAERELEEGVHRLALLPDESALLVANMWTDTITALAPTDLGIAFLLPVAGNPHALAVDAGRRTLVVGAGDGGTVSIFDTDTFDLAQQVKLGMRIRDIAAVPVPA
jgi:hypothetical protein